MTYSFGAKVGDPIPGFHPRFRQAMDGECHDTVSDSALDRAMRTWADHCVRSQVDFSHYVDYWQFGDWLKGKRYLCIDPPPEGPGDHGSGSSSLSLLLPLGLVAAGSLFLAGIGLRLLFRDRLPPLRGRLLGGAERFPRTPRPGGPGPEVHEAFKWAACLALVLRLEQNRC